MQGRITRGSGGRRFAPGVTQIHGRPDFLNDIAHMMLTGVPRPLVHRLFLTPDDILEVGILLHDLAQVLFRERIQLLQANNGNIADLALAPFSAQIVINFA